MSNPRDFPTFEPGQTSIPAQDLQELSDGVRDLFKQGPGDDAVVTGSGMLTRRALERKAFLYVELTETLTAASNSKTGHTSAEAKILERDSSTGELSDSGLTLTGDDEVVNRMDQEWANGAVGVARRIESEWLFEGLNCADAT